MRATRMTMVGEVRRSDEKSACLASRLRDVLVLTAKAGCVKDRRRMHHPGQP